LGHKDHRRFDQSTRSRAHSPFSKHPLSSLNADCQPLVDGDKQLVAETFDLVVCFDYFDVCLHYQQYLSHIFERSKTDGTTMPSCSSSTPFTFISSSSQKARESSSLPFPPSFSPIHS